MIFREIERSDWAEKSAYNEAVDASIPQLGEAGEHSERSHWSHSTGHYPIRLYLDE